MSTRPENSRIFFIIFFLRPVFTTRGAALPSPTKQPASIPLVFRVSIYLSCVRIECAACEAIARAINQAVLPDWFTLLVIAAVPLHLAILLYRWIHRS